MRLLARFKIVNVARIAQKETRGQNPIQRQFRGEIKSSKHCFRLLADQTAYLFAVTESSKVSIYVSRAFLVKDL